MRYDKLNRWVMRKAGRVEENPGDERICRSQGLVINEVQLLLAEKRTSLATLRTGIATLALPLSVLSILIATSKYYDILHVMHLLIPLLVLCASLTALSIFLVTRAVLKIRHYDQMIQAVKQQNRQIGQFID